MQCNVWGSIWCHHHDIISSKIGFGCAMFQYKKIVSAADTRTHRQVNMCKSTHARTGSDSRTQTLSPRQPTFHKDSRLKNSLYTTTPSNTSPRHTKYKLKIVLTLTESLLPMFTPVPKFLRCYDVGSNQKTDFYFARLE
jgi:hypothetical protein